MLKTPVAISLVCCEQVIIEEGTKNITLVNCFSRREVDSFPAEPFPFVVFAMLTDGQGEMPLEVTIQRLDTWEETFRYQAKVRFSDSLRSSRCRINIKNCFFPHAGEYEVSLTINKELIAHRKIQIVKRGQPNE